MGDEGVNCQEGMGAAVTDTRPYAAYLGDGLYVDYDGYQIALGANDPVHKCPTDVVYLNAETVSAFLRYLDRLREGGV